MLGKLVPMALSLSFVGSLAHAQIKPVNMNINSLESKIVGDASSIFRVHNIRVAPDLAFKLVSMDSPLANQSDILMVGEEVGGQAGFESAFILNGLGIYALADVEQQGNSKNLEITFFDTDIVKKKATLTYDKKMNSVKLSGVTKVVDCSAFMNQMEMTECVQNEYKKEDKKLNTTYQAIMKKSDRISQTKLRSAQQAWIKYRDTKCEIEADSERGGSLSHYMRASCLLRETMAQTKFLVKR